VLLCYLQTFGGDVVLMMCIAWCFWRSGSLVSFNQQPFADAMHKALVSEYLSDLVDS
jgi:hypothetical protein